MDPIALAQAGPVAILLVFITAVVLGAIRGDWVPGYLYKAALARAEKAETQSERNTDALEAVASTVKTALEQRRDG